MAIKKTTGAPNSPEKTNIRRQKLGAILSSNPSTQDAQHNNFSNYHHRNSTDTSPISNSPSNYNAMSSINMINYSNPSSAPSSPYNLMASPWTQSSPYINSPWIHQPPDYEYVDEFIKDMKTLPKHGLIGSLLREEGHIYSLAASGDFLYTGSESKNIRVWKDLEDFSGFKSSSGLVKAIVVFKDRIFTGHQDGKIRVWRNKGKSYSRVGNLPTTRDLLLKYVNPRNYVQVRRNRNIPWIKHYDAVSCISVDTDQGLLYSGSWDRTLKVWRISDSKCLESIHAHDDAVNSVVVGFDGLVFTGSADGSVKAWRRELVGKHTEHVLVDTLMEQDHALTSLAVCHVAGTVYAGSSDGLVSYWERERHFMTYGGVLRGHKLAVLCLAAAGNLVISGSADKSLCVWRRDGGGGHECVSVLTGHYGPVKCLAVEKDKSVAAEEEEESGGDTRWIVYSGSLDKNVKVWRVSEGVSRLNEVEEE